MIDDRRWLALCVIATATLMVVLDSSIINIALPHAQRQLGIAEADRHWAITAYALTFGGLLLLGGKLADFIGRKQTMILGLLGFAAASTVGGFANGPATFFIARALQGVFAAALTPAALALVTVTFVAPDERAKAFGIYGAVAGAAGAVGLLLGGLLTDSLDWRWCMFINVLIAILAALAAVPLVKESRAAGPHRFDLPGAVSVTLSATFMVLGLSFAAEAV